MTLHNPDKNRIDILETKRLEVIRMINDYSKEAKNLALSQVGEDRITILENRIKELEDMWNTWIKSGKEIFKDESQETSSLTNAIDREQSPDTSSTKMSEQELNRRRMASINGMNPYDDVFKDVPSTKNEKKCIVCGTIDSPNGWCPDCQKCWNCMSDKCRASTQLEELRKNPEFLKNQDKYENMAEDYQESTFSVPEDTKSEHD